MMARNTEASQWYQHQKLKREDCLSKINNNDDEKHRSNTEKNMELETREAFEHSALKFLTSSHNHFQSIKHSIIKHENASPEEHLPMKKNLKMRVPGEHSNI